MNKLCNCYLYIVIFVKTGLGLVQHQPEPVRLCQTEAIAEQYDFCISMSNINRMEVDRDIAKILYNLGESMIHDDKSDLGWTTYRNRKTHHYGGHLAPNHSSPFHHWQVGTLLCLTALGMGLMKTAQEAQEVYREIQDAMSAEPSTNETGG